jgi:hypothetical protein
MGQLTNHPNPPGDRGDSGALMLSFPDANALAHLPPQVEIATMRQMMDSLFARVDSLQQNQAIQLAGVHDRLDAVELEIPVIQEQSALRMRDLEARVSQGFEEAAATLQLEVAGKFNSLAAQMEAQRDELSLLRESKKQADTRLNRAIEDIERLCSNMGEPLTAYRPAASPIRHSRNSEHIRAPGPLVPNGSAAAPKLKVQIPEAAAKPAPQSNTVPGFEAWKRQFMLDGEPQAPSLVSETAGHRIVICPRCYSDRTRPATLGRLDRLFHMAGFTPHRCRSCAHRFYKRDAGESTPLDDGPPPRTPDAMETQ